MADAEEFSPGGDVQLYISGLLYVQIQMFRWSLIISKKCLKFLLFQPPLPSCLGSCTLPLLWRTSSATCLVPRARSSSSRWTRWRQIFEKHLSFALSHTFVGQLFGKHFSLTLSKTFRWWAGCWGFLTIQSWKQFFSSLEQSEHSSVGLLRWGPSFITICF